MKSTIILGILVLAAITHAQGSEPTCSDGYYRTGFGECRKCDTSCQDCIGPTNAQCTNCAKTYEFYTNSDGKQVCTSSIALEASKTTGTVIAIVVVASYFVICGLFCVILAISARRKARQQELENQGQTRRTVTGREVKIVTEEGVPIATLDIKMPGPLEIAPKFFSPNFGEYEHLTGIDLPPVQPEAFKMPEPADEKDVELKIGAPPVIASGPPPTGAQQSTPATTEPLLSLPELQAVPPPAYVLHY